MAEEIYDFASEPADGWLHDDKALLVGDGVFYSFPVTVRKYCLILLPTHECIHVWK